MPPADATQSVLTVLPELILLATVCLALLLGPIISTPGARGLGERWTLISLLAFAAAWWAALTQAPVAEGGYFAVDGLGTFVRMVTLTLGPVLVLLTTRHAPEDDAAEAHAALLALLAGVSLTAMATDLIGLFLALELVSIPTYVYLYLPRRDVAMQEATIKYFLLSVLSSALVLYGMSWLYGAGGSTRLADIAAAVAAGGENGSARLALFGVVILTAGLCFRLAAAPFHFYAPDVFQGVNGASAAMLSVAPKIVGFVALARLLPVASGAESLAQIAPAPALQTVLGLVAVATMFIGNLLALRQNRLHRLLAYSSIAHSGYMLVGLVVGGETAFIGGQTSLWFYMAVYGVMTLGLFALLAAAGNPRPLEGSADLAGLSQTRPAVALAIAVCLFSLTGLPPTAGFTGKLQLFLAGWSSESPWGVWLAVALAVNSAIAAYYYLRLIAVMYLDPASGPTPGPTRLAPAIGGGLCAVAAVALFVAPQWLLTLAGRL